MEGKSQQGRGGDSPHCMQLGKGRRSTSSWGSCGERPLPSKAEQKSVLCHRLRQEHVSSEFSYLFHQEAGDPRGARPASPSHDCTEEQWGRLRGEWEHTEW